MIELEGEKTGWLQMIKLSMIASVISQLLFLLSKDLR